MAGSFKITAYRSCDALRIDLTGHFDETSTFELIHYVHSSKSHLKRGGNRSRKIIARSPMDGTFLSRQMIRRG
jgi:hypothetical protein